MAEIPLALLPHRVQVETYLGAGSRGDSYSPVVEVQCFQDEARRLVRSEGGDEVVSEVTLFCRLAHDTDLVTDSRVTLSNGRVMHVIGVKRRDDGGLGAWQHLEVQL